MSGSRSSRRGFSDSVMYRYDEKPAKKTAAKKAPAKKAAAKKTTTKKAAAKKKAS